MGLLCFKSPSENTGQTKKQNKRHNKVVLENFRTSSGSE